MYTKIVAITQPLVRSEDNTRFLSPEEFIVYCARVSNPNNQLNTQTSPKLIQYCMEHEHWSIFEQCFMTAEIQTSRDISAQIIRHKSFSFQEFSQRYSSVSGLESFDIRKQAEKNRQSSTDLLNLSSEEIQEVTNHLAQGIQLYNKLLSNGAARESARKILPMCTQTTLYMSGTVRSWIHYLKLRTKPDTQLEHREVAFSILKGFEEIFPIIGKLITEKNSEIKQTDNLKEVKPKKNSKKDKHTCDPNCKHENNIQNSRANKILLV